MQTFSNISNCRYHFPPAESYEGENFTAEARDLIFRLLVRDPKQRLGACSSPETSYEALKAHPFFLGIDFDRVFLIRSPIQFGKNYKRSTIMQKLIDTGLLTTSNSHEQPVS